MALSSAGYVPKRLPQLKTELDTRMLEVFGPINLNAESVFGQLVGLTVEQQAEIYAQLEEVYWSQYPASAQGVNLDRVVSLNGLERLPARATNVQAVVSGSAGTVLALGRLARATDGTTYQIQGAVTLAMAGSVGATVEVATLTASADYTITIGGTGYTYNSGPTPTRASILTNLKALLPVWTRSTLTTGTGGDSLRIEYDTPQTLLLSANLAASSVSNYASFAAQVVGPIALPVGALNTITTPVSGWVSISNRAPGSIGRAVETDDELRLRRTRSLRLAGANTLDSIVSRIQQVPGVITQRVVANSGNATDAEGIPAHSIRAIVDGGTDADVARILYTYVAAGIGYYGAVTYNVVSDVTGQSFPVKFDRPTNVPFYVTVTVKSSVATPTDAIERIRSALMDYAAGQDIAEPLLYTRLFTPINGVIGEGAYVQSLTTGLAASPTGTVNIVPTAVQRLVLAPGRIQVFVLAP